MKFPDQLKHHFLNSMPKEIPQEYKHKIIEYIEKITDLFEEDDCTLERLAQFGMACTITSQIYQEFASDLISEIKDIEKNNLKLETMH